MNECQFADDTALLATNRHAAEVATLAYVNVARDFGLTVSLTKTKMMVTGYGVGDADREPIVVGESEIGCVDEFPYLGSMVSSCSMNNASAVSYFIQVHHSTLIDIGFILCVSALHGIYTPVC